MEHNMKTSLALLILVFGLSGCSTRGFYESGLNHKKNQCIKEAQTSQQLDKCRNEQELSYDDYKKQRQAIIDRSQT
mgnify:CR=1 FL=1